MSSNLSPSSNEIHLVQRQAQPSNHAGEPHTPTSENSLAGATASHERAEHPLKAPLTSAGSSLRLETSVRFSSRAGGDGNIEGGGLGRGLENEDLGAKLSYWQSRQEHVDAIDFYKFAQNGGTTAGSGIGGTESTAVGGAGSGGAIVDSTMESAVKDSAKYAAAENITPATSILLSGPLAAAAAAQSPVSEKMVTIVGKRILPPPPSARTQGYTSTVGGPSVPALPPKVPVYKTWFNVDDVPRVPPKIPVSIGSQDTDTSFYDSENSNYTTTTTPTPTPWTYRSPPPPPPPRLSGQSTNTNNPQSSRSYRQEANNIISKYTKSLTHTSPSDGDTEALIADINRQIDLEFKNSSLTEGQKINAIAKYVHEREKLRASPPVVEPKTRSSKEPKSRLPPPSQPSPERLNLRSVMTSMQKSTIGSRTSLKLGVDLVMRYYTSSTNLTPTHLTSTISNLSKPNGLGLAEVSMGFSFVHMCIRLNKLELVKELVEVGGANLKDCDDKTQTLIRNAIWYADADMIEYLISKGEDINARSHHDSISPLHHAVAAHNLGALGVLIRSGADVNATIRKNRKDIALICRKKNTDPEIMVEILQTLLANGGRVAKSADGGITPALLTGATGNERVLEILETVGVDREDINKLREFALSAAILYNDVSKVQQLIEEGYDLNRRDIFRWRPLDSAVSYKRGKIEEILSAAGALPASKRKDMERRKKQGSGAEDGGEEERGSSDWSAAAMGDRSDPEQWEGGKDLRVKGKGIFTRGI
ncbi:hypothetical protein AOL_s00188g289 [Orbilia oligospora ATCC 24927]|uniref:Uncharacterized protein n=1 Tax=Arthrobotrys oligospora (strain ATCC 24927 / CBS 115.81 / DSM 1491) TaxID=756982 RepID=G1XQS7_ARTOA|nr:hypothetical protein AOL_s00188g289 [Orbilia oligospora ATCC 24927]EGX44621.1 hypothetical protein AOL_s00188g289 [Orbilia oligospora ATCC 24927]